MDSAINFRDFGGVASRFGGTVRGDVLYRCGHLAAITPEDVERLLGMDFALIADLRYARERENERSPWPPLYAPRVFAHRGERSNDAPHIAVLNWVRAGKGSMIDRASGFYRLLPFNRHYRALFGEVLVSLAQSDGRALVHCTAGKDRTGILVSLILHALGVPRDAIMADYMRSRGSPGLLRMAASTADKLAEELGREQAESLAAQMYDVHEVYLEAAWAEMERQCGSLDGYLESAGFTAAHATALRERLLA